MAEMDHLDIENGSQLHYMCDSWRASLMSHSDFLRTQAASVRELIRAELIRRGMDHRGLLGSDANRAAKSVSAPMEYAADLLTQAAAALTKPIENHANNVAAPIQAADSGKQAWDVAGAA